MDRDLATVRGSSVDRVSRNDDISTRGEKNPARIALDQAVILAAQLQVLGAMAKAHDAEYCAHARDTNIALRPEESLARLQANPLHIWLTPKVLFAPNAAEALRDAKRQGLPAGSSHTLGQPE